MEAMEVAAELGMPRPHIVVSKREVFESAAGRAPWSEHTHLYEKLHIVDAYSDQEAIIRAARANDIDAVFVGYGYTAERVDFIARLEAEGIIPIAPPSKVMEFSGSKLRAKRWVSGELGIAVLPGSDRAAALAMEGEASDEKLIEVIEAEVAEILDKAPGQVIRLKAVQSGGGKGQRLITEAGQAASAAREIWAEISATGNDGDKGVLVEANLSHPRHWEIQVMSDGETVVHFGGRECSIQNAGSQKFIETSLHPGQYDSYIETLDAKRDAALIALLGEESDRIRTACDRAAKIIGSLGYKGAATVEFLVAEDGSPEILGKPHFMEINSRIQVEHRVSEAISRVGGRVVRLVGEQFRIAAGQKLGYTQADISFEGYAIEARINASNSNFLIGASGSAINHYEIPPRDGSFYYDDGGAVSLFSEGRRAEWEIPNFDSNFALAVFHAPTQLEAFALARENIERFEIRGNEQLRTTRPFHLGVLGLLGASPPYGKIRTDFSEIFLAFGATIYHALQEVNVSEIPAREPLRRLLIQVIRRCQDDPGLAIALAFEARRLRAEADGNEAAAVSDILNYSARLVGMRLFVEEVAAIEGYGTTLPGILDRILEAVAGSRIFEFRRNDDDLEFTIPDNVADPKARKLLIEELRDTAVSGLKPRTLIAAELKQLADILKTLWAEVQEHVDDSELLERLNSAMRDCTDRIEASNEIRQSDFMAFAAALRNVKWTIRKSSISDDVQSLCLTQVGQAMRIVRGPNVVAHLAGTIFLKSAPDKPPYVQVGDDVREDETVVALLENMKMFNEIRAHMTGKVKQVLVENERPVLPGDIIMVIE